MNQKNRNVDAHNTTQFYENNEEISLTPLPRLSIFNRMEESDLLFHFHKWNVFDIEMRKMRKCLLSKTQRSTKSFLYYLMHAERFEVEWRRALRLHSRKTNKMFKTKRFAR